MSLRATYISCVSKLIVSADSFEYCSKIHSTLWHEKVMTSNFVVTSCCSYRSEAVTASKINIMDEDLILIDGK